MVPGVFILFFLVFVVGGLAVMIYALVDAIRMPSDADFKSGTQLVWILVGGATAARAHPRLPASIPPPPAGVVD